MKCVATSSIVKIRMISGATVPQIGQGGPVAVDEEEAGCIKDDCVKDEDKESL